MKHSTSSLRLATLFLIGTGLTLTACASNSDRRVPPDGGERGDRGPRQARTSGTFLQPAAILFAGMDLNNDKIISRAEMLTGVKSEWGSFDSNPSATKFSAWSVKTLGSTDANPTFMSFDRDFNQVITETEFSAKNKDGKLERAEMIVAFQAPTGRAQGGERGQGRGGQGRGGQGRGQGGGGGRQSR